MIAWPCGFAKIWKRKTNTNKWPPLQDVENVSDLIKEPTYVPCARCIEPCGADAFSQVSGSPYT